ncbi:hypothetical protein OR1_00342 [Geobacter sp. OR-1]|uniref:hypothetical protein n=1 Tax=Geobacter sp. OR-1 TaxID=1266765 RepID=UPI000543B0B3|nr:hypothetical protein [Geobacter sp. OR-1]GAM08072.1 hypothetical protein OR1_00342 [Geobacter sp. OR-1]
MKIFLLLLVWIFITADNAQAYTDIKAMVLSEGIGDAEATNVAYGYEMLLTTKLGNRFRCLKLIRMNEISALIGWARMQQLIGTPEEKQIKLQNIADAMGVKYLIRIKATHQQGNPSTWINIAVLNTVKQNGVFYDTRQFSSPREAIDAVDEMVDRLEKGIAEHLSMQKDGYGEICPFTGRVDVYREISRQRNLEEMRQEVYCNGMDQQWRQGEQFRYLDREVWSLERFGNPDTRGGVEGTLEEKTVQEEDNPCYVCGPSEIGRWVWNRTVSASGAINGLSDKSTGESIKNKDATVRLHFKKDGTYTVTVKAASVAGTQTKTIKESATGMCNTFNRNEPPASTPLRLQFEYTFGPFTGSPFDKKLAEKIEVKLPPKEVMLDTTEEAILRLDFDLERPAGE